LFILPGFIFRWKRSSLNIGVFPTLLQPKRETLTREVWGTIARMSAAKSGNKHGT
jgi:hypothetical protein